MTDFKIKVNYGDRIKESKKVLDKYPDRVPVIVSKANNCDLNVIDKSKFLVPKITKLAELICIIRKRIKLEPDRAIFIFINNVLPPNTSTIGELYEEHKDLDGFLYVTYNSESVFG